jgi:SAM-dependent methyltransferase
MHPTEVAESYDRIASRWTSSAFDSKNGVEQHKRALGFMSRMGGAALDVGCGSNGRFLSLLHSQGFEVEGLDISSEMLRLARAAAPHVTFHHADICDWVIRRPYDFISAWDSIWHVPLSQQRYAYMGVPMYHATLGIPQIINLLAEGGCILRHFEYDQYPQPHVYFVAQRRTQA